MKYCPRCKLKARDEEASCSRCGGALRVLGGGPAPGAESPTPQATQTPASGASKTQTQPRRQAGATQPGPTTSQSTQAAPSGSDVPQQEQLRLELAGLQHQVTKSAARVRWLAVAAVMLALLLVLVLFVVRHNHVMEFAALEDVDIVASKDRPGTVEISYQPSSAGKVEFERESPQRRETLVEYATDADTTGAKKGFTWSGEASARYTVHVRYRRGWGIVTEDFQSSN